MATKKTFTRITLLQAAFNHFQMYTQGDHYADHLKAALAIVNVIEVSDCGSCGGFDPKNPRLYKCNSAEYNQFLTVLNKYPGDKKLIKSSCGADVDTLTEYFNQLYNLRQKVYNEFPAKKG